MNPHEEQLQRFIVFCLENYKTDNGLNGAVEKALDSRTLFPTPLSPQKGKTGSVDDKWKVIINMEIESDL
jgi:predicted transcriptional regulator of viral defense system